MAYNFGDRWLQRAQDSGGPGTIYCHASFSPKIGADTVSPSRLGRATREASTFFSLLLVDMSTKMCMKLIGRNVNSDDV